MNYLYLFLLFGLPLIVFPWGTSFFETPKILLAELTIAGIILLSLLNRRFTFPSLRSAWLVWGLFALSIFHLVIFPTTSDLFGNVFRLQGVFLFWCLLGLVLVAQPLTKLPPWLPVGTLAVLAISTILISPDESGRTIGLLGEPNALAATSIFLWPFTLSHKRKIVTISAAVLTILILALTRSRSGLIGFGLEGIFFLLISRKIPLPRAFLACIAFLVLSYTLPFFDQKVLENRALIWQTAASAGANSPLIGNGVGSVETALRQKAFKLNNNLRFERVDSSHNFFLDWWVAGGMIGLGLIIILITRVAGYFLFARDYLSLGLLLGLLAVLSFNPVSITTLVSFWRILGTGSRSLHSKNGMLYS